MLNIVIYEKLILLLSLLTCSYSLFGNDLSFQPRTLSVLCLWRSIACVCGFIQAGILQGALKNQGIESFLKNEVVSCVFANSPGFQIEVYVFKSDYEKAKGILIKGFPDLVKE